MSEIQAVTTRIPIGDAPLIQAVAQPQAASAFVLEALFPQSTTAAMPQLPADELAVVDVSTEAAEAPEADPLAVWLEGNLGLSAGFSSPRPLAKAAFVEAIPAAPHPAGILLAAEPIPTSAAAPIARPIAQVPVPDDNAAPLMAAEAVTSAKQTSAPKKLEVNHSIVEGQPRPAAAAASEAPVVAGQDTPRLDAVRTPAPEKQPSGVQVEASPKPRAEGSEPDRPATRESSTLPDSARLGERAAPPVRVENPAPGLVAGFETLIADSVMSFDGQATGQTAQSTRLAAVTTPAALHSGGAHDPRPVVQQVTEALVSTRGDQTEVALSPEELGRVRLVMSGPDRAHITIWAERPETLELVRRNADMLTQHLSEAGVDAGSLDFRQETRHQGPDTGSARSSRDEDDPTLAPAALVRLAPTTLSDRRIDIRL